MKRVILTVRDATAKPGTLAERWRQRIVIEDVGNGPELRLESQPGLDRDRKLVVKTLLLEVEEAP